MIYKIPYKQFPSSWGGTDVMAVLNVQIARAEKNAPRSKRFEATIDSGAGRCIFHSDIGNAIGLDIEKGEPQETLGITGIPSRLYVHDVLLYAPGGPVTIRAGFTDSLPIPGLLGMTGFFDHFRVFFNPTAKQCELERIFQA